MSRTLASDMIQKSGDVLLDRVERQVEFTPDEARELLNGCLIQAAALDRRWEQVQHSLEIGVEGKKLRLVLKELIDDLDISVRALGTASQRLKKTVLPAAEKADGVAQMESAVRRANEMRRTLSELLARLEAPAPEIDLATLPSGSEDPHAPGYINLDEFQRRLTSLSWV